MANLAKSVPVMPHFEIGSQGLRIIQGRTLVGDLRRLRMRQLGLVARNKSRTRVPWGIQLRGSLLLPLLLQMQQLRLPRPNQTSAALQATPC